MPDETPRSEIVLYQTEDGQTRVQCRFESETIWLTQKLMAELFQKGRDRQKSISEQGGAGGLGRPPYETLRKTTWLIARCLT